MDEIKKFELLRSELKYEADLIVQRTSLFVAAQAFLFTSLAAAIDWNTPAKPVALGSSLLFPTIPVLAMVTCLITSIAVFAGIASAGRVRRAIIDMGDKNAHFASAFQRRSGVIIYAGLLPPMVLPLAFATVWILILMRVV